MRIWKKTISQTDNGKKLETFLRENGFTKKEISRLKFKNPGMQIDNLSAKSTAILKTNQTVQLFLDDQNFDADYLNPHPEIAEAELNILYEDSDLLAVHKPSGLSCHPGKGHYNENLGSTVSAYCIKKGIFCPIREIGRLDKDTSGIVVFAKNRSSAARLWLQKENNNFYKIYTVLVHGTLNPLHGQITFDMEPVPNTKNRMRTCENGIKAITNYKVIKHFTLNNKPFTLLKCQLETGRTHQIRVHMAALGHPVAGDVFYGTEDEFTRLHLHAGEVFFLQPYSHEKIHISIPAASIPFE